MSTGKSSPLTQGDIQRKINSFSLGDKIQVITDTDKEEIVTIIRFYPRFMVCRKQDGTTFSLHNFDAMKARLIKPSGFEIREERMDVDDMIRSLGDTKIGE